MDRGDKVNMDDAGKKLRKSVLLFMTSSLVVLLFISVLIGNLYGRGVALVSFLYTAPLVVAFSIFACFRPGLFQRPSGQTVSKFELANVLTAMRIFLVPPMLVMLRDRKSVV